MSGLPARPTPTISPSFTPMLALQDAEHGIDDDDVADQEVELARRGQAVVHHEAGAERLAPAAQHLVAVARLVALDQREEVRVAEADAVARGGPVARRVLLPADLTGHGGASASRARSRRAARARGPRPARSRPVAPSVRRLKPTRTPPPAEGDEPDALRLARPPADGVAGRDVEVHAPGVGAVEHEPPVHLEEREVGADEDRVVGEVLDVDLGGAPPRVDGDRPLAEEDLAGLSSGSPGARGRSGPDRPLDVEHAHAVAEEAFDLDGADRARARRRGPRRRRPRSGPPP